MIQDRRLVLPAIQHASDVPVVFQLVAQLAMRLLQEYLPQGHVSAKLDTMQHQQQLNNAQPAYIPA